jgi:hypothetical protein
VLASNVLSSLSIYISNELTDDWLSRVAELPGHGWALLVEKQADVVEHRAAIAELAAEAELPIAEFRCACKRCSAASTR